ncbi:M20/M25/M40 family metallo-hydrolase [Candidatus Uabimicrobium amorphum]|uniref:Carboxypeptidase Q n=1 Tax=Uabimicrobium amorphum TaxID=2596890 RepID=A0A5S9F3H5_UABAM|nr:M20/M25/M40 family metallo-hydrolase [Candidatus Uabimicrobium amorphum]BBM83172.1 peptidase M28 [Candidatus Uabimicrobium amorphum]
MYRLIAILLIGTLFAQETKKELSVDEKMFAKIYQAALEEGQCYENLRALCKDVGPRLSGSPQAEKAVMWSKEVLEKLGMKVTLQEVMVPHWVRGAKEKAHVVAHGAIKKRTLNICALGGSVGTGEGGLRAEIVEVHQFSDLEKLGKEKISGKIVFFNRPMKATNINAFVSYSQAVGQRTRGAVEASKYGAVGVLVRSMNLRLDDYPHTGTMRYQDGVKKIPAAAVSTNDAEFLSNLLREHKVVKMNYEMHCKTLPDAKSYNVIGEVKGSEFPKEIIAVGGHLDSWDIGEGAHDDGAGCVQAIEVMHLFNVLKIKPKRTLRVVMFMNEENGLRGAREYARVAKEKGEVHVAAVESDSGGFTPRGFSIDTAWPRMEKVLKWQPLFAKYNVYAFFPGRSAADVGVLKDGRATLVGFKPDSQRYFDYHHAASDVFEAVNKRELELGSATITALMYLFDRYGME